MNKVHGKKANTLVYDYNYDDLYIIPTPSKLSIDRRFTKYVRRYNTYAKMMEKWLTVKGYDNDQFLNRTSACVTVYSLTYTSEWICNRLFLSEKPFFCG